MFSFGKIIRLICGSCSQSTNWKRQEPISGQSRTKEKQCMSHLKGYSILFQNIISNVSKTEGVNTSRHPVTTS